jgi:(2S)-methylsuccinyl-CoA dehydrogenase
MAAQLAELRVDVDRITTALADRCSVNGQQDPEKLNAAQVACFELAWAQATLQAAECAIEPVVGLDEGNLELGRIFAVEALSAVHGHLEAICDALELPEASSPSRSKALSRLNRQWLSIARLKDAAHWTLNNEATVGRLPLEPELGLMRDQFERFALREVAPVAGDIHRLNSLVPERVLAQLREMGLFGLSVPEHFGGSATLTLGDRPMIIATEALSEVSLGGAGSLITRPEILTRAVLAGGTPAQQAQWLPRIAAGDPLCAIAISEPNAGSDVAAVTLRGTPCQGGWKLDGAKTWCTFAGKAGLLLVLVRTDPRRDLGHRGLSLMLVEKPSEEIDSFVAKQPHGGRLSGSVIRTPGYRGMHSFDLSFEDFFVPDNHVVGEAAGLGRGFQYVMAGMAGGRLQTAARACGVMRAALRAGLRYSQERHLFGATLAMLPLTAARLARSAARYVAARRLTYWAAERRGGLDEAVQASLAKLFACRAAELLTRDMQQLHGGLGYAEESAVCRYFLDARVLSIFEGSEETLAIRVIARHFLSVALGRGNLNGR